MSGEVLVLPATDSMQELLTPWGPHPRRGQPRRWVATCVPAPPRRVAIDRYPATLNLLQAEVGGWVDVVPLSERVDAWVLDEAWHTHTRDGDGLEHLEVNWHLAQLLARFGVERSWAYGLPTGPCVLAGNDGTGGTVGLADEVLAGLEELLGVQR